LQCFERKKRAESPSSPEGEGKELEKHVFPKRGGKGKKKEVVVSPEGKVQGMDQGIHKPGGKERGNPLHT